MKKVCSILTLMFAFIAINANAEVKIGFDGCYQLYVPGAMYPAICLRGTTEEGISGSGVRLAIFDTNTDQLARCLISTGSSMTETSYTFEIDGRVGMILQNVLTRNGRMEGDAVIGSTHLKFVEIDSTNTNRLMGIVNSSAECN